MPSAVSKVKVKGQVPHWKKTNKNHTIYNKSEKDIALFIRKAHCKHTSSACVRACVRVFKYKTCASRNSSIVLVV